MHALLTDVPIRTLLVEDTASESMLMARLLAAGHEPRFDVFPVDSLQKAEAILAERRMDLVILDLGLPDVAGEMDGVLALREAYPDTTLVVATGVEANEELRAAVLQTGAQACLFKSHLVPEELRPSLVDAVRDGRKAWADFVRVARR